MMNLYMITALVFGLILGAVWFFVSMPSTVYLPVVDGVQEDPETRKKKAQKVRSRRFVFGIGGTVALCLLSMFGIWISGPATKVYAALNATNTPTVTNTATITNTPTITSTPTASNTPTVTATSRMFGTLAAMSSQTAAAPAGSPTRTPKPSAGLPTASGGGSVTVYRTVIAPVTVIVPRNVYVNVTEVVYVYVNVPVTVVVTSTPTFTPTATGMPSDTPTVTPSATETPTETPSITPTVTETITETPTP